ncbi:Aldehyde dehydrogenase family 2 member C4 [Bienertia sinuspersici]
MDFTELAEIASTPPPGYVELPTCPICLEIGPGYGETVGGLVASHMDIDKLSFTGSAEVERLVMETTAKSRLKPVSLELGGKSPLIIFDDADVDLAAQLALKGAFYNKA